MDARQEFVKRVFDLRSRGASARKAEREALAAAMSEMDAALGSMLAFKAMDSAGFPVTVERVQAGYESEGMPEFGAVVTAVSRDGGCSRLYVQARTAEADEFLTLTLHPSKGEPWWTLEASTRGFDGTESDVSKDFSSSDRALHVVKTRLLAMAIRRLSRGELAGLPVLPFGDENSARVVSEQVREAIEAGAEADRKRKAHAAQTARSAGAVQAAWHLAEGDLGFLAELGYVIGGEATPLAVRGSWTGSGVEVSVDSDENRSTVKFEVHPEDPFLVSARIVDSHGRNEAKGYLHPGDLEDMRETMRYIVLAEIEGAEASYLPVAEREDEPSPGTPSLIS